MDPCWSEAYKTVRTQGPGLQSRACLQGKDTVLIAVLGVLLHSLQVLLVALEAPGVVCDLRNHIALLQAVV